jgi:hypothetical protein
MMKITKKNLQKIIKEETQKILQEEFESSMPASIPYIQTKVRFRLHSWKGRDDKLRAKFELVDGDMGSTMVVYGPGYTGGEGETMKEVQKKALQKFLKVFRPGDHGDPDEFIDYLIDNEESMSIEARNLMKSPK